MSRRGIVNVRMVVTEEKILSNIDKVQKLINPNSKKKIVQLQDDSDFKDLIESIKTYLIEYPKKKNFPVNVYKATYGLVEFATIQFEENTKKVEKLIKQREENIALSGILKDAINAVDNEEEDWKEQIEEISDKFPEDVIKNLNIIATCKNKTSQTYLDTMKLLKARVNNLESNLHIEIDMDRLEDSSKALSYIGIEVAEALKLIPTPEEQIEAIEEENKAKTAQNIKETNIEKIKEEKEKYVEETTFEAKPSLWQKFKNSKIVRAATYIFRIRVRIELPSNALPEGNNDNIWKLSAWQIKKKVV
mgnify:FL=1